MKITGSVLKAKTKEPLGEAKITLSVGTTEMASLYSDGKGYFAHEESTDYIGETLTCTAEKEGFKTKTLTHTIKEQIIPLEIAMEKDAPPNGPKKPSNLPKILIGAGIGVVVLALVLVGVFVIPKFLGNGNGTTVEILPPEIVSFTAAPSSINKGDRSILTWKTKNAAEVIIEPIGIKTFKSSGSNEVRPDKTTTYTLMARNKEGKKVRQEVKVKVEILRPKIVPTKIVPIIKAAFLRGTYTIQQKSNRRYMDAHEGSNDNSVVTRGRQNNDTQRWILTPLGKNTYTIQQKSNRRYMDAHEGSNDNSVVTRGRQNNDTQRWIIRPL